MHLLLEREAEAADEAGDLTDWEDVEEAGDG